MAENQPDQDQSAPEPTPSRPEPPPFSPDLELIGYIERGQKPAYRETTGTANRRASAAAQGRIIASRPPWEAFKRRLRPSDGNVLPQH